MNINFTLLFLSLIITTSSCTQRMYFPEMVNTPGFTEKGEVKATTSLKLQNSSGSFSELFGAGIDVAYAPATHFVVTASYRGFSDKKKIAPIPDSLNDRHVGYDNNMSIGGYYNGQRCEIGGGYFKKVSKHVNAELLGGFGIGNIERKDVATPLMDFSSKYYLLYLQPDMSLHYKNVLSFTWGAKIAMHKYYDFISPDPNWKYYIAGERSDSSGYDVTGSGVGFGFLTPFANLSAGYKFIRFNVQLGTTVPFTYKGRMLGGVFPNYLTIGLAFHYAPRYFDR